MLSVCGARILEDSQSRSRGKKGHAGQRGPGMSRCPETALVRQAFETTQRPHGEMRHPVPQAMPAV